MKLNKEIASDSGIDEEEEYFEPTAMEPSPGATDDSGTNKSCSRNPEQDPKDLLSSAPAPSTSIIESMRIWALSAYTHSDTKSREEPVKGDTDKREKDESNPINNGNREDNFKAVADPTDDEDEASSDSSDEEYPEDLGY